MRLYESTPKIKKKLCTISCDDKHISMILFDGYNSVFFSLRLLNRLTNRIEIGKLTSTALSLMLENLSSLRKALFCVRSILTPEL
jgi:hypothetical protein